MLQHFVVGLALLTLFGGLETQLGPASPMESLSPTVL